MADCSSTVAGARSASLGRFAGPFPRATGRSGVFYAAGWVLMIAAMMLPTTLPIVEMFRRIVVGRTDPEPPRGAAHPRVSGGMAGLRAHRARARSRCCRQPLRMFRGWPPTRGWSAQSWWASPASSSSAHSSTAASTSATRRSASSSSAGAGQAPSREALRLGIDHGLFCVGCCWALMLLMFVVGTGSIGWMLALAAVMAAEKNLPGWQTLAHAARVRR